MEKTYYVYILASARNGTLYVGMTNDIARRAHEHRTGAAEGFTRRHSVHRLVHIEPFADVRDALQRERRLKEWKRRWKLDLIEKTNPQWRDLWDDLNT